MSRTLFIVLFVLAASTVCSAQTFYFPQVAVGAAVNGDSWTTTIFLSNAGAAAASGTITLTKSDGTTFHSNWRDEAGNLVASGGVITFQLGPSESRRFTSVVDIMLSTGFATVNSNSGSVLGTAVFTNNDWFGNIIAEAGVPMGIPLGKQAVFVDTTKGFKTGVAIANPNGSPLHINFELVNNTGQIILRKAIDVPPNQHIAQFVHELFPEAPQMVGRLQFYCMNPMVSVALRFDPAFSLFTTMPPIAILP